MPSVPAALDLGAVDLNPPEQEPGFGEALEAPPSAPEPEQPNEPKTVVKAIRWAGGDADRVLVQSPAAVYAAQLLNQKADKRANRSLGWSLAVALIFLAVGGVVLERTARAIKAARQPAAGGAALQVRDLGGAYYTTREGRAVFVVRGKVDNTSKQSQGPAVKVTVELTRGTGVERSAEVFAGKLPTAEEIWSNTGPLDIAELTLRVGSQAGPLEPGASAAFVAVFGEFPDDLADLSLHAVAVAATPPFAPPPAVKPEPAAPKPDESGTPAKAAGKEPGRAEPGKPEPAKPEPAKAGPARPAGTRYEFPMDDPQRPLKIQSGQPAPGKH